MVSIVINYWGHELKKIKLDPNNEKEIRNAINLVINTIFTVLGPHDEIYINDLQVDSPEKMIEILRKEIKRKRMINVKIRPFAINDKVNNIEDKGLIKLVELTYYSRF